MHHTTLAVSRATLGVAHVNSIVATAVGANTFACTTSVLRSIGLSEDETNCVRRCFTQRKLGTLKMMRLVLKGMSTFAKRSLCMFLWSVRQAMSLTVGVLPDRVRRAQKRVAPKDDNVVLVCAVCATIKVQVQGVAMPKTKMGVSVDPFTGVVSCVACGFGHVVRVNMLGRTLTIGDLTKDIRKVVLACCGCGRMTSEHRTVGMYPLCMTCAPVVVNGVFDPKTCLCGRIAARGARWTVVRNRRDVRAFALCSVHEHHCFDTLVNAADAIQAFAT